MSENLRQIQTTDMRLKKNDVSGNKSFVMSVSPKINYQKLRNHRSIKIGHKQMTSNNIVNDMNDQFLAYKSRKISCKQKPKKLSCEISSQTGAREFQYAFMSQKRECSRSKRYAF